MEALASYKRLTAPFDGVVTARDTDVGALMPGSYGNVRLDLPNDTQPLHIPAGALIFDQIGLPVAVVGSGDKVVFKTIAIARDLGREIEIASGLTAADRVIVSPSDGLRDGDQVRLAGSEGKGKASSTASAQQPGKTWQSRRTKQNSLSFTAIYRKDAIVVNYTY